MGLADLPDRTFPHQRGLGTALGGQRGVAQRLAQPGPGVEGQDRQRLETRRRARGIAARRPVEKARAVEPFAPVRTDLFEELSQQGRQIGTLFGEVGPGRRGSDTNRCG